MPLGTCELCRRPEIEVTRHHLIPRARHPKRETMMRFGNSEMKTRIAQICRACHKFIHRVLTERELAREYNTIDRLLSQPEIAKFVRWVSIRPVGLHVPSARLRR